MEDTRYVMDSGCLSNLRYKVHFPVTETCLVFRRAHYYPFTGQLHLILLDLSRDFMTKGTVYIYEIRLFRHQIFSAGQACVLVYRVLHALLTLIAHSQSGTIGN